MGIYTARDKATAYGWNYLGYSDGAYFYTGKYKGESVALAIGTTSYSTVYNVFMFEG